MTQRGARSHQIKKNKQQSKQRQNEDSSYLSNRGERRKKGREGRSLSLSLSLSAGVGGTY